MMWHLADIVFAGQSCPRDLGAHECPLSSVLQKLSPTATGIAFVSGAGMFAEQQVDAGRPAGGGGMGGGGPRGAAEAVNAEPKLFIGQLLPTVTREDVFNRFSMYGAIKNVTLLINNSTGKSKGCAMVTYERFAHAEAAIAAEDGSFNLSGDRKLVVKFADPTRKEDGRWHGITPKKLFVGQVLWRPRWGAVTWRGAACGVRGVAVPLDSLVRVAVTCEVYACFSKHRHLTAPPRPPRMDPAALTLAHAAMHCSLCVPALP